MSPLRATPLDFERFASDGQLAVAEGAVVERLARDPSIRLDAHILNGGLVYDAAGRARLAQIHSGYVAAARDAGLAILTFTDTWRCSRARIEASPFRGRPVNEDNARLLADIRDAFGAGPPIFIGGQLGPSGDAYKPGDALDRRAARAFHRPQVAALASAGVDFLHLSTAPSAREALGVADAMSETGLPYMISFVIRRTGTVLDGTPLGEAIATIDAQAARPPVGFSINCVHSRVLDSALAIVARRHPEAIGRVLSFQANTADKEVEELDNSADLHTEPPEAFADGMVALRRKFGLRFVGGCCGTDGGHIQAVARRLRCAALD